MNNQTLFSLYVHYVGDNENVSLFLSHSRMSLTIFFSFQNVMNENVLLFRSRFFSLFALRSSFIHSTKLMFALRSSLFALHSFHQAYVRASFRSSLFALLSSTPPSLCSRFFSLFALRSFFITFTQLMFAARSVLFLLLLYPAFAFFLFVFFFALRDLPF